ncbi:MULTISPECIES: DUF2000 domain-containing protein [Staphylococcus]|uniref:DUF2000 domain-containing protein n=1 Tax=Staphylococcus TaxID=1279 RepID=UPI000D1BAF6F|nr:MULTISPECIES: DUF2000 domain-containing protein [Staphylococcus]MDU9348445.1 DUF2000 domain-containing protein [Staphylococcus ureilyticus]PTG49768.1 DUF2000 domain-containing protein [Staphylococcus cohnii]QQV52798.1 DUF2000 family protein [Staphylococcus sp. 11-B-312]RIL85210.1 DUF2000 domain-containing protein [Staphylococcus cohnii]
MVFDTKIKIVLREDLEVWQKLNVTAFLMSGIAGTQNIIGEYYIDKDNVQYLPMSQQPVMIHSSTQESMVELLQKSLSKDVVITVYTEELFSTYNDADNRAVIAKYKTEDLNLVGIGIRGKKNHVDKLFKGFALHS